MKFTLTIAVALASVLAVAAVDTQSGMYPSFPFCNCIKSSVYGLEPTTTYKGNNTYCVKLTVTVPPGCKSYCCTKADLRKLEINVKPECQVGGVSLSSTLNGVPTKVGPVFDKAPEGPVGSTILRLTQLGLNLTTANGAEICFTLGTNKNGKGCLTLEDLCVPPAGSPAGVCSTSMFDTLNDCCSVTKVKPPPPPCKSCVYVDLNDSPSVVVPYNFTAAKCAELAAAVSLEMAAYAKLVNATIIKPYTLVQCSAKQIKICGELASDADGAKLQPVIDDAIRFWLNIVIPAGVCPAYLVGYTVVITVTGYEGSFVGPDDTCLFGTGSVLCNPDKVDFPKCECDTKRFSTPFGVSPYVSTMPGRKNTTTLFCFTFYTVQPAGTGYCSKQNIFHKVEFWADENIRRKIQSFGVLPVGNPAMKFISPSWGATGEETVKATPLNWNMTQANGALICMELDNSVSLERFCLGPKPNTCWLNVFNPGKECCPLFEAMRV